jgi:hypothetical protein
MNTNSVAVGIMTIPARAEHCRRLVERIGGDLTVHVDVNRRGCWPAWKATWLACAANQPRATHIAILADDIAVCADLRATLEALVAARPHSPIGGWLPRAQVELAHAQGIRWASTRSLQFVQLLVLPRELGDRALDWVCDREHLFGDLWGPWDDERLKAFTRANDLATYVPVPNICDHLGGDGTIPSSFGHRFAPESARARVWLGEAGLGAAVDWSDLRAVGDQPVHPYRLPRLLLTDYNSNPDEVPP